MPDDPTTLHVQRARAGDAASVEWLVVRFAPLLRAQARYRLSGRNLAVEPDDVVHDVWTVALPALPGLRMGGARQTPVLVKFLATTLLYRVNELTRQHIRRGARAAPSETASPSRWAASTRGALTRAADADEVERVLHAIQALPDADREVVVLRGIEQLENARVAALLGQSANAVSLRFNRAMRRLRAELGPSVLDDLDP